MWRQIKAHISIMFKSKITILMYIFMYVIVLVNYFDNVITYYGYNIPNMISPMKLLFLSDYEGYSFYFLQYYPLLVVIPASFAFVNDITSKEILYMQARMSKRDYYTGKSIAVFLVTFIVFTVPMLCEYVLNIVSFPLNAIGDQSNTDIFDELYAEGVERYLFADVWISNRYVYAFVFILMFGIVSGILALFAGLVSSVFKFKFKILVFFPVYLLLNFLDSAYFSAKFGCSTDYFFYFKMFSMSEKSDGYLILFNLILVLISCAIIWLKTRKDELL